MRKISVVVAVLASIFFIGSALADGEDTLPVITKLADASQHFNTAPRATLSGEVSQVFKLQYSDFDEAPKHAIILKMSAQGEERLAYIGPSRFLDNRGYTFEEGASVTIHGVLAVYGGQQMELGDSVEMQDALVYALRDSAGKLNTALKAPQEHSGEKVATEK